MTKDRNHIISSRDIKQAFDKIQPTFMINVMNQLGMKEARVNVRVKSIYSKPRGNSILSGRNHTTFP